MSDESEGVDRSLPIKSRGVSVLARISHRKVARSTMEALNSGTETEFPLWRNRAVCRF